MTAHEFDRVKFFGIGIPDDPTEEDAKRVLMALHIGKKVKWSGADHVSLPMFVDVPRWNDGYQPRFYMVKNRTI